MVRTVVFQAIYGSSILPQGTIYTLGLQTIPLIWLGADMKDLYTVEITDPPPGWDDRDVDVRHREITSDQIGFACSALLKLSHNLWLRAGISGTAVPVVSVRKVRS